MEPYSPTSVGQDETLQLKDERRVRLGIKSNLLSMRAGRQWKKSSDRLCGLCCWRLSRAARTKA